ncbi:Ycf51 family protein [Synechococcus sp. H70.2]|uniref:Ycf51 family protein n=1 Tax=unclassified Synechococcus TaxID=2626047 RepID=UPI0039C17078
MQSFFASAAQVGLGVAGLLALLTLLAWLRNWPWKFSLVGYTAFTLVLTAGCFALSLGPIFRSRIPGAAPYTTVYDQGAERAVIAVSPDITPEQLILTLKQAASDLASSGRFSTGSPVFTLQARTVIHPEPGVSEPLLLGTLQQPLGKQQQQQQIRLEEEAFARLQKLAQVQAAASPAEGGSEEPPFGQS